MSLSYDGYGALEWIGHEGYDCPPAGELGYLPQCLLQAVIEGEPREVWATVLAPSIGTAGAPTGELGRDPRLHPTRLGDLFHILALYQNHRHVRVFLNAHCPSKKGHHHIWASPDRV